MINKVYSKISNSLDAACNSYIMDVIGMANGISKWNPYENTSYKAVQSLKKYHSADKTGKILPTHPLMKGAKVSQETMDSFHELQVELGTKHPYGLTRDGIPIVSIFESSDTAVDAMGRAILLKRKPPVPELPTPSYIPPREYEYAYAT